MSEGLSADSRELVHQLLEDVQTMEAVLFGGAPRPAVARNLLAPILRRWIVERQFYRAQKILRPTSIKFQAVANGEDVKFCKAGVYDHWMGMVEFQGVAVGSSRLSEKFRGGNSPKSSRPEHHLHDAHSFFEQRIFFWKGEFYHRADAIKMLANALGGVHLDFRKQNAEQHIGEIRRLFGYELKPNNNIQMLVGLEIEVARSDVIRREKVYDAIELVAIDTARIFNAGVRNHVKDFRALLS